MLAVFVVYQWIENHLLSPMVMSRTVKLNPLWVLLAVLVGAQLGSIVGALFAIPTAGAIQVVVRELFRERGRGRRGPPGDAEGGQPAAAEAGVGERAISNGAGKSDPIAVGSLL